MGKWWICGLLAALLLSGCGTAPVETVSDFYEEVSAAPASRIQLELPKEAVEPVLENGENHLYLCDGYELRLQIMPAGNLSGKLREITGFPEEKLKMLHTVQDGNDRWDFVWCSAGEDENQIGRGAVVDDGNYYYCVSTLAGESRTAALQESWQRIFDSIELG